MSRNQAALRVKTDLKAASHANPQWLDRRDKDAKVKNTVRVTRYWQGKKPDWAPEEEDEDAEERNEEEEEEVRLDIVSVFFS